MKKKNDLCVVRNQDNDVNIFAQIFKPFESWKSNIYTVWQLKKKDSLLQNCNLKERKGDMRYHYIYLIPH